MGGSSAKVGRKQCLRSKLVQDRCCRSRARVSCRLTAAERRIHSLTEDGRSIVGQSAAWHRRQWQHGRARSTSVGHKWKQHSCTAGSTAHANRTRGRGRVEVVARSTPTPLSYFHLTPRLIPSDYTYALLRHYFCPTSALLHCFCPTSALLLPYFCPTSALLLHYFCPTSVLLPSYFCPTSALLLPYFCPTSARLLHYFFPTSVLLPSYFCLLPSYFCHALACCYVNSAQPLRISATAVPLLRDVCLTSVHCGGTSGPFLG